jgi:CMP-N-acetylneuraminic acid synthetase
MIAEISEYYGANVLIRPKKFANDDSIDLEWAKHFYSYYSPDYIAHLRPTTPLRDPDTIKRAINMAKNTKDWDSIVSVQKVGYNPHKLLTLNAGYLQGYLGVYKGYSDKVLGNLPDQKFTPVYRGNGYIDILKKDVILGGSMRGEKILPFFSEYTWEIDEPRDVKYIEFLMNR